MHWSSGWLCWSKTRDLVVPRRKDSLLLLPVDILVLHVAQRHLTSATDPVRAASARAPLARQGPWVEIAHRHSAQPLRPSPSRWVRTAPASALATVGPCPDALPRGSHTQARRCARSLWKGKVSVSSGWSCQLVLQKPERWLLDGKVARCLSTPV